MPEPPTPQQDRAATGLTIRVKALLFLTVLREAHRQAAKDFRVRWRPCGLWCLVVVWLLGLIFSLVALTLIGTVNTPLRYDLGACLPDGSFTTDPAHYRYFSASGFFDITLAFGSMTFTQVKVIDVAWNILVGRGGQTLLAYISWRIFANYVTISMEVIPVTFRTYRTIFLQNGSLLVGISRLVRDFCSRHALHSRFAMVFMVFTMAFSLAFPTLVGSLTGYKGKVDSFVKMTQGNYVPFSSFDYVSFVIYDGSRIGLRDNYIVKTGGIEQDSSPIEPTIWHGILDYSKCFDSEYASIHNESCAIHVSVTACTIASVANNMMGLELTPLNTDVGQYGFNGEKNITSRYGDKELPPPTLNISSPLLIFWPSLLFNSDAFLLAGPSMQWMYENATYTETDLLRDGKCQPNLEYQWGFSFIQSIIIILLLLIWSIGIYVMWLHSHSVMKRRGRTEIAGEHKAVLELAQAMQQQYAGLNSPIQEQHEQEEKDGASATTIAVAVAVTEAALRHRVTKELRGGSIAYTAPLLANGEIADDWTLCAWIKAHKWSTAGMVSACLLSILGGLFIRLKAGILPALPLELATILLALPLELAIALYIGSTPLSRSAIFTWTFILCSMVPNIILATVGKESGKNLMFYLDMPPI